MYPTSFKHTKWDGSVSTVYYRSYIISSKYIIGMYLVLILCTNYVM